MSSSAGPTEEPLVAGIRAGSTEAFEAVFRAHHPGLLRFAHSQLRDHAAAEDIVHEVFLRLWRDRSGLVVRRSLRGYLLASVRNAVIDSARRRATESRTIEFRPQLEEPGERAAATAAETDPAYTAELDAAIRQALNDLPERCRTAFLLCREEALTYAEAADVMGVATATVKTQVARALAALRLALQRFLLLAALISVA